MKIISFYIDHNVSSAIIRGLRLRGIDCITAAEDQRDEESDEELLTRATSLNRILVSQDEDLLVIGAEWNTANRSFSGIVYSHQLGITVGRAIHDLEVIAKVMLPEDMANKIFYIPF